jgi:hypothetical protein
MKFDWLQKKQTNKLFSGCHNVTIDRNNVRFNNNYETILCFFLDDPCVGSENWYKHIK